MINTLLMIAEAGFNFKGELFKMFLSLALIITLLCFVAWWVKRSSRGRLLRINSGYHIKVIERRPLSTKVALYLIEVEGTRILVSDSASGVHRIAELPVREKVDSPFSKVLEKAKSEK